MIGWTDDKAFLKYQIGKLDHCHYILITTFFGELAVNEDLDSSAPPISIDKVDLDLEETKNNARSLMKKSSTAAGMQKLLKIEEVKEHLDD